MRIFITGTDTHIGKSFIARLLVKYLSDYPVSINVIKIIETGINRNQETGDAEYVTQGMDVQKIQSFTLYSFPEPIAPLQAAYLNHIQLNIVDIQKKIAALPAADFEIFEGAGGLSLPLEKNNKCFCYLADSLQCAFSIIVTENRLGVINQARLSYTYAYNFNTPAVVCLNTIHPIDPYLHAVNTKAIQDLNIPLWDIKKPEDFKLYLSHFIQLSHA